MKAVTGKRIRVHYTGSLQDGEVFDSSEGREPLEFVVGAGQMIAGFDKGVLGMTIGEERTFTLEPEEAYGERNEEMIVKISRKALPAGYTPEIGDTLQMTSEGQAVRVTVVELNDAHILLDGNHHLAGQKLTFAVRLVEVL